MQKFGKLRIAPMRQQVSPCNRHLQLSNLWRTHKLRCAYALCVRVASIAATEVSLFGFGFAFSLSLLAIATLTFRLRATECGDKTAA